MIRRHSLGSSIRSKSARGRAHARRVAITLLSGTALAWSLIPTAAFAQEAAGGSACAALATKHIATNVKITSVGEVSAARVVELTEASAHDRGPDGAALPPLPALPAYCEVSAVITPAPGSRIGVVYRLPEPQHWNGKLLGLGGGGWAGNVTLRGAAPGLAAGYATAQTDAGHATSSVWDTSWAANRESVVDFSYRAIHLMTTAGKALVDRYYGHAQSRAYFQGCSTGGRQALMEAQRFPADYDGIVAGAPVYTLLTQTTGLLRSRAFSAPGARLSAAQLERLNKAALAACDAADGVEDGVVTDPRSCKFDPGVLECRSGDPSSDCLSAPQVAAVRAIYAGVNTSDGHVASYPLTRGGEAGWSRFLPVESPPASRASSAAPPGANANGGGMGDLRQALFGDPKFDLDSFNADRDVRIVRTSTFAKMYEAGNPDIASFLERGGKLILWHGFSDPGPSPLGTIGYYERVRHTTGAKVKTVDSSVRLFILPGVYHCGSGPGADRFDSLTAIDQWVAHDKPPENLVATRRDGKISRPVCAYPELPYYSGHGNSNEASSFACRTSPSAH
jgi:Tannase and feruloyl esterase